jgi:ketopantoate reductase
MAFPGDFFDGFPEDGPDIALPALDPESALAGAIATDRVIGCVVHMGSLVPEPGLRKLCADLFEEAAAAGRRIGLDPGMTADERTEMGASLGDFRTSMLQDFDKSRPPEIDAIVGAVVQIGRATNTPMPVSETVLALLVQKARGMGLYAA